MNLADEIEIEMQSAMIDVVERRLPDMVQAVAHRALYGSKSNETLRRQLIDVAGETACLLMEERVYSVMLEVLRHAASKISAARPVTLKPLTAEAMEELETIRRERDARRGNRMSVDELNRLREQAAAEKADGGAQLVAPAIAETRSAVDQKVLGVGGSDHEGASGALAEEGEVLSGSSLVSEGVLDVLGPDPSDTGASKRGRRASVVA